MMKTIVTGLLVLLLSLAVSAADKREVRVVDAWARAVPVVAPVAGGFFTVVNTGNAEDRLLRVESPIAKRIEIHEMRNDGGVMRMRQITDGLIVPAHGQLELKPGSYHLMFMELKAPFAKDAKIPATLVFEKAGSVDVELSVAAMGAASPATKH